MKIVILSRGPQLYSTKRLKEAAVARGHTTRIMDTLRFTILLEHETPDLLFKGKPAPLADAVIPRIGASITYYGVSVVRQYEQMGAYSVNPAQPIAASRDKLRSLQLLSRYDVGIPPTAFVRERRDVYEAIQQVGGAPVIIKLLEGTQGVGVILAETQKVAEAIIETLQSAKQNVLIQKFVKESKGRDVRAIVVGDKVIAAMRRTAQGQEFRSNVHRGGTAEAVELAPEYERTAVKAAKVLGLRVAGVDMLEAADGPQVMEVNSSPGLEGIERATGLDVADEIIRFIESRVAIPDVDVRYRTAASPNTALADVPVVAGSELIGKTLAETELRDRLGINVLSISRSTGAIPNPSGETELHENDVLLCFGDVDSLQKMMPARKKRKRRKKLFKQPDEEASA